MDRDDISILDILMRNILIDGSTSSMKTMTPIPPMKCVEDRQKSSPFGNTSTSVSMVPPVVVYPDTDSNQAFDSVNSPPQSTYGSIPKMQLRNQEKIVIAKPSRRLTLSCPLTNIRGKLPTMAVISALRSKGENAESNPFTADTASEMNIKIALKTKAIPIYRATSLIFMTSCS